MSTTLYTVVPCEVFHPSPVLENKAVQVDLFVLKIPDSVCHGKVKLVRLCFISSRYKKSLKSATTRPNVMNSSPVSDGVYLDCILFVSFLNLPFYLSKRIAF